MLRALSFFAQKILEGEEGVFFSVNKPGILNKKNWIFGWGKIQVADFEKGPFPFFLVTDFKGKKSSFLHFENWKSFDSEKTNPIKINTSILKEIELNTLSKKKTKEIISLKKDTFIKNIKKIKNSQKNGEIWVLNLAQNFGFKELNNDELKNKKILLGQFYRFLKAKKNHCGGLFITNKQKFCSFSPEIFLQQKELNISTFPIKGTGGKEELENSEKEISELLMITDLLRNDLGEICQKVEVVKERFLTKENHFFHAQSQINGLLKKNLDQKSFFKLLPAGSISGAPKKRVVEKISELESFERNFYTGVFGVRFSAEHSLMNLLIRTLFLKNNEWYFPVGAGITIDSDPQKEFEELLLKTNILDDFCFF